MLSYHQLLEITTMLFLNLNLIIFISWFRRSILSLFDSDSLIHILCDILSNIRCFAQYITWSPAHWCFRSLKHMNRRKKHPINMKLALSDSWLLNMFQCFNVNFFSINWIKCKSVEGSTSSLSDTALTWWEWAPSRRCHRGPLTVSAALAAQMLQSSHFQSWHSPYSPDLWGKTHNTFIYLHIKWNIPNSAKKTDNLLHFCLSINSHTLKVTTFDIFWFRFFSVKFGSSLVGQITTFNNWQSLMCIMREWITGKQ